MNELENIRFEYLYPKCSYLLEIVTFAENNWSLITDGFSQFAKDDLMPPTENLSMVIYDRFNFESLMSALEITRAMLCAYLSCARTCRT